MPRSLVSACSVAALSALTALSLTACGSGDSAGSDGKVTVAAAAYPFAFVAERVGGDDVDVLNLTQPGAEPHDVELSPQQTADLESAAVIVYEPGFQAAVDDAISSLGISDDKLVDVASGLDLLHTDDEGHGDEHADADGEEDHDHGSTDPHVWLDPANMEIIAREVADGLAAADPDHAATYDRNARTLIAQLTTLDRQFTAGLKSCARNTIVTSHEAFGYLAHAYGLEQIGIAGIEPSSEPSGAQLAEIAQLVKNDGITTIFTEELVDPANADTIAENTGARVATLDPIEGLSDDTAGQNYLTLMRRNLEALRKANDCT